jgi:MFS family permease
VRELDLGAGTIGVILGVGQAGGIVGALLARRIAERVGVGPAFIGAIALSGPAVLLIALADRTTAVPFLTLGWTLWSFASLITAVVGVSIRQAVVPQHLQGRVVGATRSIIFGIVPLGALVGGALAATIGLRATLVVAAAVSFPAFLPLLFSPARRLRVLPADADPAHAGKR